MSSEKQTKYRRLNEDLGHYRDLEPCDVVLRCGDRSFRAHKAVLITSIPYFKTTFGNGDTKEITVDDSGEKSSAALSAILDFVYSDYSTREMKINMSNAIEIHATAQFFLMEDVVKSCVRFMVKNLTLDQVLPVLRYSDSGISGSKTMMTACYNLIEGHMKEFLDSEQFMSLEAKHLQSILQRNAFKGVKDKDMATAIWKWVDRDLPERKQHLRVLIPLANMRRGRVEPWRETLAEWVNMWPWITTCDRVVLAMIELEYVADDASAWLGKVGVGCSVWEFPEASMPGV